ncbi:hypothetical protein IAT38_004426 [Cryptococcus sp. DSM 104549]
MSHRPTLSHTHTAPPAPTTTIATTANSEPAPAPHAAAAALPIAPAAADKPRQKRAVVRGPVGEAETMRWQSSFCCLLPLGTCFKQQSSESIYCLSHTCQAVNVDGERCANGVFNPRESRYCHNGWHVETARFTPVTEMVTRRRQLDVANAARRAREMEEQMALFHAQFANLASSGADSGASAASGRSGASAGAGGGGGARGAGRSSSSSSEGRGRMEVGAQLRAVARRSW